MVLTIILTSMLGGFSTVSAGRNGRGEERHHSFQNEHGDRKDRDNRRGQRAPNDRQRDLAARTGARVRWNALGTPASLINDSGFIATGLQGDEVSAARAWVRQNRELFRLSEQSVADLEVVYSAPIGPGRAVLFRQRFNGLPAGRDGLLAVGVVNGNIAYVSSSIAGEQGPPSAVTISAEEAIVTAAAAAGLQIASGHIGEIAAEDDVRRFKVQGLTHPVRARLAAVPTAEQGLRSAWEIVLIHNTSEPVAFIGYVDGETNAVLLMEDLVDYFDPDNPSWEVFPASPPLDYSTNDTRERWCWMPAPICDRTVGSFASPLEWDVDPTTGAPSETSRGNNASSVEKWLSNRSIEVGTNPSTPRPDRNYNYIWTNQWYVERCNPDTTFTSAQRNDIDTAIANLFVGHNQLHDWSYHLGFTEATFNLQESNFGRGGAENDPEQGNAQAGGVVGGPPGFQSRDNANQITPPDGTAPITNMYLWQPIAGGFYAPCVDGDFDMTVIGHEYAHAISNRMVAGPNAGLRGPQSGAMGESWSDLVAMEQLNEYGLLPLADENPYAVGPYVTGEKWAGIRNYAMNASPLNYSDIAYDLVGQQVHADGEIWSATNFDIRRALVARYNASFPADNAALQRSCADGELSADACPGNRRWIQLVFDAWLLMAAGNVSMVDARDAMLAADALRFGGANQDLLWNSFAARGLGADASSNTNADADPLPSFESPYAAEATVVFQPKDDAGNLISGAKLFVGHYEARAMPVADTDPTTALSATVGMVPGIYDFVIWAPGYGHRRTSLVLRANQIRELEGPAFRNLASSRWGATASGDGLNHGALIDETEATNWAALGEPVAGKQVMVRLSTDRPFHMIRRIQVSAMLRPRIADDPGGDTGTQNRFSALRQFAILACQARPGVDCSQDAHYQLIFTSPPDAFPADLPRPTAPDLLMRSFDVPRTKATHVQLRVLTNQCTGTPEYAGEQDNDPRAVTDCAEGSIQDENVRAAELQVFSQ